MISYRESQKEKKARFINLHLVKGARVYPIIPKEKIKRNLVSSEKYQK